jgi:hypothetical protein
VGVFVLQSLAGHRLLTELERSGRSKEPGFWLGEEALERHQDTCKISDLVLKDVSRTFPKHSMYLTYDGQVNEKKIRCGVLYMFGATNRSLHGHVPHLRRTGNRK